MLKKGTLVRIKYKPEYGVCRVIGIKDHHGRLTLSHGKGGITNKWEKQLEVIDTKDDNVNS